MSAINVNTKRELIEVFFKGIGITDYVIAFEDWNDEGIGIEYKEVSFFTSNSENEMLCDIETAIEVIIKTNN